MARAEVVQAILDLFEAPSYLEIGVATGATFHAVAAAEKIAVDPRFKFDVAAARIANPEARYHTITSDAFFAGHAADRRFDVIYIDGLHTFEQTLRDLMNSVSHIHPGSVIAIDDIYPDSIAAALPDPAEARRVREQLGIRRTSWMGDVYKLVLFIDSFMPAWDFRCVEDNHGQLVMWQAPRPAVTERLLSAIGAAGYERAVLERKSFRFTPLTEILDAIRAVKAAGG